MPTQDNPYNAVDYVGHARVFAHPRRLQSLARLFGLRSAGVDTCRVLELGCGDAVHLLWIAAGFPAAHCVGVDVTAGGLNRGRELAAAMGLANVELVQADILDLDEGFGEFDYIIAHGVYSWVPQAVRDKLLSLCARNLAPNGVALVSYNAKPASHFRHLTGELMRFHTRAIADPAQRVREARRCIEVYAGWLVAGAPHAAAVRSELARIRDTPDYVLYHDDLTQGTRSFSLQEFLQAAGRCGLRYLTEASLPDTQYAAVPAAVRDEVAALAPRREEREQYLDYVLGRAFRRTLLCHAAAPVRDAPDADAIGEMFVGGRFAPAGAVDVASEAPLQFDAVDDKRVTIGHPLLKAALCLLGEAWPESVAFALLLEGARRRCGRSAPDAGAQSRQFRQFLLDAYAGGVLDLNLTPLAVAGRAGVRPVAHSLARVQAQRGSELTSVLGVTVQVGDAFSRGLLRLLDGTRDRDAIAAALVAAVDRAEMTLPEALQAAPDWRRALREQLDENLDSLARLGLLCG